MKHLNILLVEDTPADSQLISLYLKGVESFKHTLTLVRTLKEANTVFTKINIDIILLDLGLPGAMGVENIREVLKMSPSSAVIIMIDVYGARLASEAIYIGAQDFLVKSEADSIIFERTILKALARINANSELEKERQRFRTVVDTAMDAIITTDDAFIIQSWNDAATTIFSKTENEVLSTSLLNLLDDKAQQSLRKKLTSQDPEANKISLLELRGVRKNGERVPLEFSLTPWKTKEGLFYTAIIRDIAERCKIERMKSEFVSTVSHELRTPLTALLGSLKLVLGGALGTVPDKINDFLAIAHDNSNRLLLLINDILDMNKIEAGQMDINYADTDLMEVIQTSLSDNKLYATRYNVTLKINKKLPGMILRIDRFRFLQIMANFLSNASKFSPEGDSVEINTLLHESSVRIAVSDHGPGIPVAFQHRVFHKFAQADASDTRQKGGTGLGLNISKALVEKMGGSIGFESEPNVKTTFYIDFPLNTATTINRSNTQKNNV